MANKEDRLLIVSGLLTVICLVAYFLVFLPPTLKSSGLASVAIGSDLQSNFLPRFVYGSRELFNGRLPLWNPYEYGGIPFLATAQPAVFYPPKAILFGLFSENVAYWLFMGLHYLALAGGFLLFAREQRIDGVAAFVGTVAWTFALPTLLSNYHPTRIANLAPVPFCFLFVERIGRGIATKRSAAWLVTLLALQLTAGYPEVTLDLGLLVALHAVVRFLTKEWPVPPWKTVSLFALLWALAALVAAVQLAPMVEAALVANRTAVAEAFFGPPVSLTQSLRPGPLFAAIGRARLFVPCFFAFTLVSVFHRRTVSAIIGAAACIALFQGGWFLLRLLPGLSMIRFPFVWIFMTLFYVAWMAASGAQAFLNPQSDGHIERRSIAAGSFVALGWAVFCAIRWRGARAGEIASGFLASCVGIADAAALGIVGSIGVVALGVTRFRAKAGTAGIFTVLLVLALSHLAGFPYGTQTAPVRRPTATGVVRRFMPGATRGRALSLEDAMYGYELTDEIPNVLGSEESLLPWRYRQLLRHFEYEPSIGRVAWIPILSASGFLDAMNVEFVTAPKQFATLLKQSGSWVLAERDEIVLARRPRTLGSAWVNYSTHLISVAADVQRYILDRSFDPGREVVVEEALTQSYAPPGPLPRGLPKSERRSSSAEVEYDVDLPLPGVLVSSENFYPGWSVYVDGKPRKLLLVDYVLRGVEVPPGPHVVRFEYRPTAVRWGSAASLLGILALGALFVWSRRPGD